MAIEGFKSKALKRFMLKDDARGISKAHAKRVREILVLLHGRAPLQALSAVAKYDLHPLKGNRKGLWAVTVSGNLRITFRVDDRNVFDVDLIDYH